MIKLIKLDEIEIQLEFKNIKNTHLSVNPPDGKVTLTAPNETRFDVVRAYAISKLSWIKNQQKTFKTQSREISLNFINGESHYLWGRRYLLFIKYADTKPFIKLFQEKIILTSRQGSSRAQKEKILDNWYRSQLKAEIPRLINKWQNRLGVEFNNFYLQKMKTRWGSCNPKSKNIRINTELVKKPRKFLDYIVMHEISHLLHPNHNDNFIVLLNKYYPSWREVRMELNELPIHTI